MEVVCNMKQNTPGNLKPLVQLEFYRLNGSWYPKKKKIFMMPWLLIVIHKCHDFPQKANYLIQRCKTVVLDQIYDVFERFNWKAKTILVQKQT